MARWKLMTAHYLNVAGTKWEYQEVSRVTGKQIRMQLPVPMYLDPRGRRELICLLPELGGTRIVAAHDLELILQTCGRVLLLDHGRRIADGPTRAVLADATLMEAHGLEVPYTLRH